MQRRRDGAAAVQGVAITDVRTGARAPRRRIYQRGSACSREVCASRALTRRTDRNSQRARALGDARSAQTSRRLCLRGARSGRWVPLQGRRASFFGSVQLSTGTRRADARRHARKGVLGRVGTLGSSTRNMKAAFLPATAKPTDRIDPPQHAVRQKEVATPSQRCARQRSSSPPWRGTRKQPSLPPP